MSEETKRDSELRKHRDVTEQMTPEREEYLRKGALLIGHDKEVWAALDATRRERDEKDRRLQSVIAVVGTQTDCQCQGEHDCLACRVRKAATGLKQHEDPRVKKAIRERDEARAALERAKTYKGIEGYGCPMCEYRDGKFIKLCSLHERIAELEAACAVKDEALRRFVSNLRRLGECICTRIGPPCRECQAEDALGPTIGRDTLDRLAKAEADLRKFNSAMADVQMKNACLEQDLRDTEAENERLRTWINSQPCECRHD